MFKMFSSKSNKKIYSNFDYNISPRLDFETNKCVFDVEYYMDGRWVPLGNNFIDTDSCKRARLFESQELAHETYKQFLEFRRNLQEHFDQGKKYFPFPV